MQKREILKSRKKYIKKTTKDVKKQKNVENCEGLPLSIMTIWINSFKIYMHFA